MLLLEGDGGLFHVAREDDGLLGEDEELVADARHFLFEASARQVRAADGATKERIAAEEHAFLGVVADAARCMARCADASQAEAIDFDDVALLDEGVGVWRAVGDFNAHALGHALPAVAQQVEVALVQEETRTGGGVDAVDAEDVVDVSVRVGDVLDPDTHIAREGKDFVGLVTGVDADGFAGAPVADDPAVFLEHPDDDAADHEFVRYFHWPIVECGVRNVEAAANVGAGWAITARMDWPLALAIVLLAAIAAFIQALSGFGFSLFLVPFMALLIGPKDTVLLANLLSTAVGVSQTYYLRHDAERRLAGMLMAGSVVGMPVGIAVLMLVNADTLQLIIAGMVIFFTLLLMRGLALHSAGLVGDLAAGFTSGVLNTSTSMSGPPVVLYLHGRGLPPLQFRATTAVFFFVTSCIAVTLLLASGNAKPYVFGAFALSVPSILIGQRVGNLVFKRVNLVYFRRMVYGILLLSGTVAIIGTLT